MEAMGYAQLTDSSEEGHLPDVIFRPLGSAPWQEVWAESKASELSLSAPRFVEEIRSYISAWLSRSPQSRFSFMIFAKKLINVSRWETIWGNDLSQSEALAWPTKDLEETPVSFTNPDKQKEVVSFLSETNVVEGNDVDLDDMAKEKRKVGLSANEIRQRAIRQLALMDQRSRPVPKKSDLVANLLAFTPPFSHLILGIDPHLSIVEIRNRMRERDYPPYCILGEGRLITFDSEGPESSFSVLNPSHRQALSLHELEKAHPRELAQLVNYAIGKMLRPMGVGFSGRRSYFLAEKQVKSGKKRVLSLRFGQTMQVARPYTSPTKEDTLQGENPRQVNFVFHVAFNLRYRPLWDQHFIEIRIGKLYTEDGATVIEGNRATRLDGRFRNPAFDRSETRQRKLEKLAQYVFHAEGRTRPNWTGMFNFGDE